MTDPSDSRSCHNSRTERLLREGQIEDPADLAETEIPFLVGVAIVSLFLAVVAALGLPM